MFIKYLSRILSSSTVTSLLLISSCSTLQNQQYYTYIQFIDIPNEVQGYLQKQFRLHGIINTERKKANYEITLSNFRQQHILLSNSSGQNSEYNYEARLSIQNLIFIDQENQDSETNLIQESIIIQTSKAVTLYPDTSYLANERMQRALNQEIYQNLGNKAAMATLNIIKQKN